MAENSRSLEERIRRVAMALGLDAVAFGPAEPTDRTRFLKHWIERGYAGEMDYLERRLEERIDPRLVLDGARSLIVVGLCLPDPDAGSGGPDSTRRASIGRVARYAGGDDYHDVLLDRVRALAAALEVVAGVPVRSKGYVDTGPVAERAAAEAAGLGWIAKNSCLINPDLGSHLMLGVILTDLELARDAPVADHCGTCRACLDVCPTDAFPEPYVLDATRCISYATIESRGPIPESLREGHGDHVFGCDLCQTVCPWNQSRPLAPLPDPLASRARLAKRSEWIAPTLEWILRLDGEGFTRATVNSALRRPGRRGLLRNALVAAGNCGDQTLRPCLEAHRRGPDPMLREHAEWALARLDRQQPAD